MSMYLDLLGLQPQDFGRYMLIIGLKLGSSPDVAGARSDFHDAVHGFHGRVGKERKTEFAPDGFLGVRE